MSVLVIIQATKMLPIPSFSRPGNGEIREIERSIGCKERHFVLKQYLSLGEHVCNNNFRFRAHHDISKGLMNFPLYIPFPHRAHLVRYGMEGKQRCVDADQMRLFRSPHTQER